MLSALPPVRLCRMYVEPSGATRLTTRSPICGCTMCTSTWLLEEALPVQPDTMIGLDTVPPWGIGKSVPLVNGPQLGAAPGGRNRMDWLSDRVAVSVEYCRATVPAAFSMPTVAELPSSAPWAGSRLR